MRKCENCYNGHYNLSNRGEELYCDESEFMEEITSNNNCCEYHRYYPGMEEEKNYIFYDESYIAPGLLIINTRDKKMDKFLKIYRLNEYGLPVLGIRAYSVDAKEDPDEEFGSIEFSFRDIEDNDNELYKCFLELCNSLDGKQIFSINYDGQGDNNIKLSSNSRVVKMIVNKDTYHGTQHPTDYTDILIGDEYTCNCYEEVLNFYQRLSNVCGNKTSSRDIKRLLIKKPE